MLRKNQQYCQVQYHSTLSHQQWNKLELKTVKTLESSHAPSRMDMDQIRKWKYNPLQRYQRTSYPSIICQPVHATGRLKIKPVLLLLFNGSICVQPGSAKKKLKCQSYLLYSNQIAWTTNREKNPPEYPLDNFSCNMAPNCKIPYREMPQPVTNSSHISSPTKTNPAYSYQYS